VTSQGAFSPNTNLDHARQRWLFRMVHSQRPLQEKMTLFWHNHFATAASKVLGNTTATQGTKMMVNKAGELPGPTQRFVRLNYVVATATMTAGALSAAMVPSLDVAPAYARGYAA